MANQLGKKRTLCESLRRRRLGRPLRGHEADRRLAVRAGHQHARPAPLLHHHPRRPQVGLSAVVLLSRAVVEGVPRAGRLLHAALGRHVAGRTGQPRALDRAHDLGLDVSATRLRVLPETPPAGSADEGNRRPLSGAGQPARSGPGRVRHRLRGHPHATWEGSDGRANSTRLAIGRRAYEHRCLAAVHRESQREDHAAAGGLRQERRARALLRLAAATGRRPKIASAGRRRPNKPAGNRWRPKRFRPSCGPCPATDSPSAAARATKAFSSTIAGSWTTGSCCCWSTRASSGPAAARWPRPCTARSSGTWKAAASRPIGPSPSNAA